MIDLRRWSSAAAFLLFSTGAANAQPQYLISTYAGGLAAATSATATSVSFQNPSGVATDRFGNIYVSTSSNCVYRLDQNGILTRVAGTCHAGFSGDGGNALAAQLNNPQGVAIDALGNLYIADTNNQRIRKVTPSGVISTVAGTGVAGYNGDNISAISAQLNLPVGIALDSAGALYIADQSNQRIRKVIIGGAITTAVGTGNIGSTGDGGQATNATLTSPVSVAFDFAGNLYVGDASFQVRKITPGGIISHFAGTGVRGETNDGGAAATAQMSVASGLAADPAGNLYISDRFNTVVRKVDTNGIINVVAGGGVLTVDNVAPTSERLSNPLGIALDLVGNLYIADQTSRLRKVAANNITTVAGTNALPSSGDGGQASLAQLNGPWGLGRDLGNNLLVTDWQNYRVRKITPAGIISTFAGNGVNADSGNGGQATGASITTDVVAVDAAGNVYLADYAVVRKVALDGTISNVAGTGTAGYNGEGPATTVELSGNIQGLALDSTNNLYISDSGNQRVRKVTPGGTISTVVGTGQPGFNGDGAGTSVKLSQPAGLAVDSSGNLYIADYANERVRKMTTDGNVTTIAGNGVFGTGGDGSAATSAPVGGPWGVAVNAAGDVFIATEDNAVRRVSAGNISTIAGSISSGRGVAGYGGDGGPATGAQLDYLLGVNLDPVTGNLYVSDSHNNAVRALVPEGTAPLLSAASSHAGVFTAGQTGTFTVSVTNAALSAATSGTVKVTDTIPAGVTLVSMSGSGWFCTANVCTNPNSVGAGGSYPALTVTVSVTTGAIPQITNIVTVEGGGSVPSSSQDLVQVESGTPSLQIISTHAGSFFQGQQGIYTLNVSNAATASPTSGLVTVTENLPSGLTLASMSGGPNWSCGGTSCSRGDSLVPGAGYDPITVTVNVAGNASSPLLNAVTASGGGSALASATDSTIIVGLTCDVNGNGQVSVADAQAIINEALGINSGIHDLNQDGKINVMDIQIVINSVLGMGCTTH